MKIIKAAHVSKLNWKQELYQFLRQYRATPHTATGVTPYRLMFQREAKTKIPKIYEPKAEIKIDEPVRQNDEKSKSDAKLYSDARHQAKESDFNIGDTVLVKNDIRQNKLSTAYYENPYMW